MSVLVMGLCFRIEFGNSHLKAVAIALADHASDDGTKIWPSKTTIARKTDISVRTVQYKLRQLEGLGLIVCVVEGGKGATDTRQYRFDMTVLRQLSDGELAIVGGDDEGAPSAPLKGARGAPLRLRRVHAGTNKGARGAPKPSLTIKNTREPAREEEIFYFEKGKGPRPAIQLSPTDPSWLTWLKTLGDSNPKLAEAALKAGRLEVDSRWPHNSQRPAVVPPTVHPAPKKGRAIGVAP